MTIGSQLKQARQQKGISLQEAAVKTKIQKKYLDALENDNFSLLPNALYLKGFLKSYAQILGLNPDGLVAQLQDEIFVKEKQVIVLKSKELPRVRTEKYFKKSFTVVVAVIFTIGLIIFLFSLFTSRPATVKTKKVTVAAKPVQKKNVKSAVRAVALPQAPAQATKAQIATPVVHAAYKEKQNVPINLFVMAKKPCRAVVKADSILLFDGFLLAGTTDQWQAKKMFDLSISDGSAVELVVNGKKVGSIAKGAKRDIVITKDGIRRSATP